MAYAKKKLSKIVSEVLCVGAKKKFLYVIKAEQTVYTEKKKNKKCVCVC